MYTRGLGTAPLFHWTISACTKRIQRTFNSLTLTIVLSAVAGIPGWLTASAGTTLAITVDGASASTVTVDKAVTLTATVTGSGGSPVTSGAVNFCVAAATVCQNSAVVGMASLSSAGTASVKLFPGLGEHSYKAVFAGTTAASSSTSPAQTITVTGLVPTTTVLSSSGTAGQYTLTGTVSGIGHPSAPSGIVSFTDTSNNSASLGTAGLGAATTQWNLLSFSSTATNGEPEAVAQGDFNGDGKMDIVVANLGCICGGPPGPDGLSVLLGNGDGTFSAGPTNPLANIQVSAVAVGDFNNDGKADLATINLPAVGSGGTISISILLGDGNGGFAGSSTFNLDGASSIATADFNGDGNVDLAVTSDSSNTVTILLGGGNGSFTTSSTSATGQSPEQVVAADFNGDGKMDLATANLHDSTISIFLDNGDGTFTAGAVLSYPGGSQVGADQIAVGDFNGDGKTDLAIASDVPNGSGTSDHNQINLFMGNGDGTFSAATPFRVDDGGTNSLAVGAGDFNGDGKTDLVYFDAQGVTEYFSNGDGTFTAAGTIITSSPTYPDWNSLAVADFNGDGIPDVVTVDSDLLTAVTQLTTPVVTAAATLVNAAIPGSGSHNLEAAYEGDTSFGASTSSTIALTASTIATQLSVTPSASSSTSGKQLTLTARLNPYAVGDLTTNGGTITFLSNAQSIGTGTLSSGVATLNITSLATGIDSITATYAGDSSYFGASTSSPVTVTVTAALGLSASPSSGVAYKNTVVLTATTAVIIPGGKWWITENGWDIAANPLMVGGYPMSGVLPNLPNGGFTTTTDPLSVGTHAYYAYYAATPPPGNILPISQLALATVNVAPAKPTITWAAPAAITYGTSLSATQLNATASVPGTFTYNPASGTVLQAGAQTLSASFTPTDTTDYATTTGTTTVTVNKAGSTTSLVPSASSVAAGSNLTLTATVASATSGMPTGMVQFLNGTTVLGKGSLTSGVATFSTSALAVGTYNLTAAYSSDTNFTASVSSAVTVSVTGTGSTVGVSSSPTSLTIASPGSSATANIQISSAGGFSGPVQITCAITYQGTGTPTDAPTCSIDPAQEQVSAGGQVTATLTVKTIAAGSSASLNDPWMHLGGGTALAALMLFGAVPRRRWRGWGMLAVLCVITLTTAVGCGGGSKSSAGSATTTGSYSVSVTATSGSASASVKIPLSVQ